MSEYRKRHHKRHKKGNRINRRMQATLTLAFFACLALFCVIIIRIIYLQTANGKSYAKQVLSQMTYQNQ